MNKSLSIIVQVFKKSSCTLLAMVGIMTVALSDISSLMHTFGWILVFWGVMGEILTGVVIHKITHERYDIRNTIKKGAFYMNEKAARYVLQREDDKKKKTK